MAYLHQKLPCVRKLPDLVILLGAAAQPDVVLVIHQNSMLSIRPLISRTRAAPGLKKLSARCEFQNGWRWNATLRLRRFERGGFLAIRDRGFTMKHPDVVM